MKALLWLDDSRNPLEDGWLPLWAPLKDYDSVVWVRSYQEFIDWILENGVPYCVCFDHDLADIQYHPATQQETVQWHEKTGFDAAKWLIDYCIDNNIPFPAWRVQSANPVGRDNILTYISNAKKHSNI